MNAYPANRGRGRSYSGGEDWIFKATLIIALLSAVLIFVAH